MSKSKLIFLFYFVLLVLCGLLFSNALMLLMFWLKGIGLNSLFQDGVEALDLLSAKELLIMQLCSQVFSMILPAWIYLKIDQELASGHPPGLLLDDKGITELDVAGMVLGPDPDSTFKLGYGHIDRGAALVLYSDGVIERGLGYGVEPFGMKNLKRWLKDARKQPAEAAVREQFERLEAHCPGKPFEDDVTAMLVKREG